MYSYPIGSWRIYATASTSSEYGPIGTRAAPHAEPLTPHPGINSEIRSAPEGNASAVNE
jgi:hypothetical protein